MRAFWEAGKTWTLPVAGVCLVLGALLGIQVHTQRLRGATKVGRQSSALVGMLTNSQAQLEAQAKEIERLRAQVGKYENEAMSDKGVTQRVYQELQTSRVALGLLQVKGPGVELELGDSTIMRRNGSEMGSPEIYLIHDYDLIMLANELWTAGAEAVSLNDQRLVAGSAIRCSGPLIQVNNTTIPSPFVFRAIGDKENLVSALKIPEGTLDRLRWAKFQVKLTPKDELLVPAIAIAPRFKYAKPVTEETP
jgi:uncharacterized protein YlxW (UPF0749 family)